MIFLRYSKFLSLSSLPRNNFSLNFHNSHTYLASRKFSDRHYVDTYKLMKRLETQGFNRTQSVCIMKLINSMLKEKVSQLKEEILLKSDLEKGTYLFKAALAELRTEVEILRKNDQAALTSDMDQIRKEIDLFTQSLPVEVSHFKVELQMDLNSHHQDVGALNKSIDMTIQDMSNKYNLELSGLKAQIEAMKWESIRRGILMVFAAASSLTFIGLLFKFKEVYLTPTIEKPPEKPTSNSEAFIIN